MPQMDWSGGLEKEMDVVVHYDEFVDFNAVFDFVGSPEEDEEQFYFLVSKEEIAVVTPKENMGVAVVIKNVSSSMHKARENRGSGEWWQKTFIEFWGGGCSVMNRKNKPPI